MIHNCEPKFNPWCAAANVVERTRRAQIPEFFTAPNIFSSPSPAPPVRANKFQLEFSYKSEQEILVTTCFYHNIKTPVNSSIMLEIYKSKTHTQPPIPLPLRPIRQHCLPFRCPPLPLHQPGETASDCDDHFFGYYESVRREVNDPHERRHVS